MQVCSHSNRTRCSNTKNHPKGGKKEDVEQLHAIGIAILRRQLQERFPELHVDAAAASILQTYANRILIRLGLIQGANKFRLCDQLVHVVARETLLMKKKRKGEVSIVASDIAATIHSITDLKPVGPSAHSHAPAFEESFLTGSS